MASNSSTTTAPATHIFGIRHHGPGSARSLKRALDELKPDCILIEGPPDADAILPLLVHKETKPPVAILIHAADDPRRAVYYPFATFSPEYQAIAYALSHKTPVRFMDLPQSHQMAMAAQELLDLVGRTTPAPSGDTPTPETAPPEPAPTLAEPPTPPLRRDPLGALAEAAGFSDGERWWEHMVEHRRDGVGLFSAILEAMTAVRTEAGFPDEPRDLLREAWMRTTLRAAQKEGFEKIAVVCGAWHAPVLANMPPEKDDVALLKTLPKPADVQSTLVPWTYDRLAYLSGYGAGVESPGWYDHLWHHPDQTIVRWMTRVARLFREEDLDCSSAHVIESVRLADSLASLRGRPLPGLPELNDAARAVFCHDTDLPMRLIAEKLIVGHRLGEVPESTPAVPLQQDLIRQQKRLRLKPEASEKKLDLDLRNETDLDRSRLLHRLALLSIPWGRPDGSSRGGKGTFHELWFLRWEPELAVSLIEAGVWGSTIEDAAGAYARDAADKAPDLPAVSALLDATLLADLPAAAPHVMARLENLAAVASDVTHLMDALPPLANILRYGNVRQTDATLVSRAVAGLVARITVGLPNACSSLNDDAAAQMYTRLLATHSALSTLQNPDHLSAWYAALKHLSTQQSLHGLVAGRATRLLLDASELLPEETARLLSLALSPANDPAAAAAWLEGFLRNSGLILLHDDHLWQLIDQWVSQLPPDTFTQTLPLIRRTFSTFAAPERRQMGERAKQGKAPATFTSLTATGDLDHPRAEQVLPLLHQLLGLFQSPSSPATRHSERSEESQPPDTQTASGAQPTEPDSASSNGSRNGTNSSTKPKSKKARS